MAMRDRIGYKFHDSLIPDVLAGRKTATVRVDDERSPEPGDVVDVLNTDGKRFASVRIRASLRVKACWAHRMIETYNANHGADSAGEMLDKLNEHYETGVSNTDPVHVLIFSEVDDD